MGVSRQEHWSGLPGPPPGELPDPGWNPCLLLWQVGSLPLSHRGSPLPRTLSLTQPGWCPRAILSTHPFSPPCGRLHPLHVASPSWAPQGRGRVKVTCQLLNTWPEATAPSSHCSLGRARQSPDCRRSGNAFPSREQVDVLSLGDRSLKITYNKVSADSAFGFCLIL